MHTIKWCIRYTTVFEGNCVSRKKSDDMLGCYWSGVTLNCIQCLTCKKLHCTHLHCRGSWAIDKRKGHFHFSGQILQSHLEDASKQGFWGSPLCSAFWSLKTTSGNSALTYVLLWRTVSIEIPQCVTSDPVPKDFIRLVRSFRSEHNGGKGLGKTTLKSWV